MKRFLGGKMTIDIDPLVVVAILGLVNFVKSLGAEGKILTLISMGIGVVVSMLFAILAFPAGYVITPADISQVLLGGLLSGLAACGLYDFGGMLGTALGGRKV
jgi:hypothetical protein